MPSPNRPWPLLWQAVVQSLLMGVFVLVSFLVFFGLRAEIAVASLGASAFIAFYFPNAEASRPRYLLGGYACGLASGLLCHFVLFFLLPVAAGKSLLMHIAFCALSVVLTGFFMSVFSWQHPPSAALAIALVVHQDPLYTAILVYGMILLLVGARSLVHRGLGRYFGPLPQEKTHKSNKNQKNRPPKKGR